VIDFDDRLAIAPVGVAGRGGLRFGGAGLDQDPSSSILASVLVR